MTWLEPSVECSFSDIDMYIPAITCSTTLLFAWTEKLAPEWLFSLGQVLWLVQGLAIFYFDNVPFSCISPEWRQYTPVEDLIILGHENPIPSLFQLFFCWHDMANCKRFFKKWNSHWGDFKNNVVSYRIFSWHKMIGHSSGDALLKRVLLSFLPIYAS